MSDDTTTIEIPKHPAHISRMNLPWVDPSETLSECGKPCGELRSVITLDDAVALAKKLGQRKLVQLYLCVTCMETAERHPRHFPSVFHRRYGDGSVRYGTTETQKAKLRAELEAIERILTEHADVIRDFATLQPNVENLADHRAARRR